MFLAINSEPSDGLAAAILNVSADTVMVFDAGGRIRVVSSTADQLVGIHPEQWVGASYKDLLHPDDWATFEARIDPDRDGGNIIRREVIRVSVHTPGGAWVPLEARGFTQIDCDGVAGAVVTFRDSTGAYGLSGARAFGKQTLADAPDDPSTIDNRSEVVDKVLPALLRSCSTAEHLCVVGVRIANYDDLAASGGTTAANDAVLRAADAIEPILRRTDLVIRLLDRRLVVACPNLGPAAVVAFAQRLRSACRAVRLADGESLDLSIGFALTSTGDDLDEVLSYAMDAAQLDAVSPFQTSAGN